MSFLSGLWNGVKTLGKAILGTPGGILTGIAKTLTGDAEATAHIQNLSGIVNDSVSNAANLQIARDNLQFQREANAQNIALQREINASNLAAQERQNEINRQREDNAVQRAAADMQAAGLSKTLAAGSPASASNMAAYVGQAPSVEALRHEYQYQPINFEPLAIFERLQNIENNKKIADAQADSLSASAAYNKAAAANKAGLDLENIAKTKAERELLYVDKEIKDLQKNYDKLTFEDRQRLVQMERTKSELEVLIKNHDYNIFHDLNLPTSFGSGNVGQAVLGFGSELRALLPSLFNH